MALPPVTGALQGAPSQPTASAAADTQRPFVQFGANTGSFPPADRYVTRDDHIQLTFLTSLTGPYWFSSRILLPNGQIAIQQERIAPAGTRGLEFFSIALPEGFLLSLDVAGQASSPPQRGSTWVRIAIQRALGSANPLQTVLGQGYLTMGNSIGWPAFTPDYLSRGNGATIENTVSNPAAGAQWSVSVPSGAVWVPQLVCGVLTTSAAVANRIPRLVFFDGAQEVADLPVSVVIPASQVARLTWSVGGTVAAPTAALQSVGVPTGVRLSSTFSIISATSAMDAADQWSNVRVVVQEYNGIGG